MRLENLCLLFMDGILSQAHWKINKQIPKLDRSLMNWKIHEILAQSQNKTRKKITEGRTMFHTLLKLIK